MASRLRQLDTPQVPENITSGSRLNLLLEKPRYLAGNIFKTPTRFVAGDVFTPPKETFAERHFPSTKEALEELRIDPLSLRENPREAVNTAWETIKETVSQAAPKLLNLFKGGFQPLGITGFGEKGTPSEQIGEKLEATAAVGHIAFSPISAFFEGASEIPILGSVSKLISLPFVAVGEAGTAISGEVVDRLPIPDEAKENIKQGVQEITALAGQLALGKITHIGTKKIKELKTKFGEKDANTIVLKAQEFAEQAKEPIEATPVAPKATKLAIAAEKDIIIPKRKYTEVPREQLPIKTAGAEKGVSALESRMKGLFETKNIKKAKLEAEERGLDVSTYDKITKPEQIRLATKYVEKASQKEVLDILEGKTEAPRGILQNAIMLALEAKSLRDKNVNLAIKLASLRSTRAGQEISILTETAGLSPVSGMNTIIRARSNVAKSKLKTGETLQTKRTSTIKEIKTEQTKLQVKINEVKNILNEITC